ncbi:HD domain-containing phosphohydrolase [Maribrevibacterium harenarium]|nr:HD domain-containing phosphohydrolase [Maribrevibacterium harenarium]
MLDLDYMNDSLALHDADIAPRTILVVDDMADNIDILRSILSHHYQVRVAKSGEQALAQIEKKAPDLILLDIMMPGMNGFEVCRSIKQNPHTKAIPVIFVTAMSSVEDERLGFEVGGADFITKPITPLTTLARVRSHIELAERQYRHELLIAQRTQQLEESLRSAVSMLSVVSNYKDEDTASHMGRMADYSALLASAIGWSNEECERIRLAAPLHDIGKIGVPDSILKAPRALTDSERLVMQQHTQFGYDILSQSQAPLFKMAAQIALAHHERWDGTGYPRGLKADDIPLAARIITLADVFDALTSKRPYKTAWGLTETFHHLKSEAGKLFDPNLVELFIQCEPQIREVMEKWSD